MFLFGARKKSPSHGMSSLVKLNFHLLACPPHLPIHMIVSLILYTPLLYMNGLIHLYSLHQMTLLYIHIYLTHTIYHQPSQPLSHPLI